LANHSTIKIIYCFNKLIARDEQTIVSKICHIEAASQNGPRYNPNMSDEERRHFDNLILLCDECHSIIDNKDNALEFRWLLKSSLSFQSLFAMF